MNPERLHICCDVSSVDLDDDLKSGTVVFVLNEAARNHLIVRLPSNAIIALRDALIALSEDPFERRNRRRKVLNFDWPESFLEEDLAEIRP
ncbi:MAG TPA: hypothetical protein VES91_08395 [Burkholderiaceae bacterium]|nr:hypothetical protein [Burkholderiaceae bacterium]